jgi:hypothetical protein
MKKRTFKIALLVSVLTTFSSCQIVGTIFKTGMGVGVFLVILIIAIVIFLITRIGKNK